MNDIIVDNHNNNNKMNPMDTVDDNNRGEEAVVAVTNEEENKVKEDNNNDQTTTSSLKMQPPLLEDNNMETLDINLNKNDHDDIIKEMVDLLMRQEEEIDFDTTEGINTDADDIMRHVNIHNDDQQPIEEEQRHVDVLIEELLNDHDNERVAPLLQVPPPVVPNDDAAAENAEERRQIQEDEENILRLLLNNGHNQQIKKKIVSRSSTYRIMSFIIMFSFIYYAFRTRKQYYLAVVFLSNSKWTYVIFGNALIALTLSIFDTIVYMFLNGLRIQEVDGLNDFFRWNVTETCLALTMFRSQFNNNIGIYFILLITMKCFHHVSTLREQHLRMTQETVYIDTNNTFLVHNNNDDNDNGDTNVDDNENNNINTSIDYYPIFRKSHIKVLMFLIFLQFIDLIILEYTISYVLLYGPTVHILFAFEAAIMLISSWSHIILWLLHCIDSILIFGHEKRSEQIFLDTDTTNEEEEHDTNINMDASQRNNNTKKPPALAQTLYMICHKLLHPWKEYKATLQFAIQLQAQAIQFIFYTTFFIIILTTYGLPINLFREVYISFIALKERLIAFLKYRQLMSSMNRFDNVKDDAELDTIGRTCIICRDDMTIHDCKKLPICNHAFHKSCLREWLVQQQTCPTCRSDITANEILDQQRKAAANAATTRMGGIINNTAVVPPTNDNDNNNSQQLQESGTIPNIMNNDESHRDNDASIGDGMTMTSERRNVVNTGLDGSRQQQERNSDSMKYEGLNIDTNSLRDVTNDNDPLLFNQIPGRPNYHHNPTMNIAPTIPGSTSSTIASWTNMNNVFNHVPGGSTTMTSNNNTNQQQEDITLRDEINDCIRQTTILFEQRRLHGRNKSSAVVTTNTTTTIGSGTTPVGDAIITSLKMDSEETEKESGTTIDSEATAGNTMMMMTTNDDSTKKDNDESSTTTTTIKKERQQRIINHTFPSLYQVVESDGASVVSEWFNLTTLQPIRTIPLNTLVLAQGRAVVMSSILGTTTTTTTTTTDNDNNEEENNAFIKIPDGWIAEKSLQCVANIVKN